MDQNRRREEVVLAVVDDGCVGADLEVVAVWMMIDERGAGSDLLKRRNRVDDGEERVTDQTESECSNSN